MIRQDKVYPPIFLDTTREWETFRSARRINDATDFHCFPGEQSLYCVMLTEHPFLAQYQFGGFRTVQELFLDRSQGAVCVNHVIINGHQYIVVCPEVRDATSKFLTHMLKLEPAKFFPMCISRISGMLSICTRFLGRETSLLWGLSSHPDPVVRGQWLQYTALYKNKGG